jgi:hypothetical protein
MTTIIAILLLSSKPAALPQPNIQPSLNVVLDAHVQCEVVPLAGQLYSVDDDAFKNGVSITTPSGTYLRTELLPLLPWKKPLHIHWSFQGRAITLACKGASQESALEAIAKALGGKLVTGSSDWTIDFDAKAYRETTLGALAKAKAPEASDPYGEVEAAGLELQRQTLRVISDEELARAFSNPNGYEGVVVNPSGNPALMRAIRLRLDALYRYSSGRLFEHTEDGLRRQTAQSQLEMADFEKPIMVYFESTRGALIQLTPKGNGNRIVGGVLGGFGGQEPIRL